MSFCFLLKPFSEVDPCLLVYANSMLAVCVISSLSGTLSRSCPSCSLNSRNSIVDKLQGNPLSTLTLGGDVMQWSVDVRQTAHDSRRGSTNVSGSHPESVLHARHGLEVRPFDRIDARRFLSLGLVGQRCRCASHSREYCCTCRMRHDFERVWRLRWYICFLSCIIYYILP